MAFTPRWHRRSRAVEAGARAVPSERTESDDVMEEAGAKSDGFVNAQISKMKRSWGDISQKTVACHHKVPL